MRRGYAQTMERIKNVTLQGRSLWVEVYALYLACRDTRTPWYAKVLLLGVVALVVSPIDPIPDFIPVIGVLDDIVVVRLGTALAVRMIPKQVMAECREKASDAVGGGSSSGQSRWRSACLVSAIVVAVGCLVTAMVSLTILSLLILLIVYLINR
jgi:uncharacterized membrane protein YkvA (DUF1232 family)